MAHVIRVPTAWPRSPAGRARSVQVGAAHPIVVVVEQRPAPVPVPVAARGRLEPGVELEAAIDRRVELVAERERCLVWRTAGRRRFALHFP